MHFNYPGYLTELLLQLSIAKSAEEYQRDLSAWAKQIAQEHSWNADHIELVALMNDVWCEGRDQLFDISTIQCDDEQLVLVEDLYVNESKPLIHYHDGKLQLFDLLNNHSGKSEAYFDTLDSAKLPIYEILDDPALPRISNYQIDSALTAKHFTALINHLNDSYQSAFQKSLQSLIDIPLATDAHLAVAEFRNQYSQIDAGCRVQQITKDLFGSAFKCYPDHTGEDDWRYNSNTFAKLKIGANEHESYGKLFALLLAAIEHAAVAEPEHKDINVVMSSINGHKNLSASVKLTPDHQLNINYTANGISYNVYIIDDANDARISIRHPDLNPSTDCRTSFSSYDTYNSEITFDTSGTHKLVKDFRILSEYMDKYPEAFSAPNTVTGDVGVTAEWKALLNADQFVPFLDFTDGATPDILARYLKESGPHTQTDFSAIQMYTAYKLFQEPGKRVEAFLPFMVEAFAVNQPAESNTHLMYEDWRIALAKSGRNESRYKDELKLSALLADAFSPLFASELEESLVDYLGADSLLDDLGAESTPASSRSMTI